MKKSIAITIISVLAVIAIALGVLHYMNNADKTKKIDALSAEVMDKAGQIESLNADVTDKAAQIQTLNADVSYKAGQIDTLNADVAEKKETIQGLKEELAYKNGQIDTLNADINEKADQIETLKGDIKEKTSQIEMLNADVAEKEDRIATLNADIEDKSKRIEALVIASTDKDNEISSLSSLLEEEQNNNMKLTATVTELTRKTSYDKMDEDELLAVIKEISASMESYNYTVSVTKKVGTILLNENNITDYFNVDVKCDSFSGNKVKMVYTIWPKQTEYAKCAGSSHEVKVKFKFNCYVSQDSSTPCQSKYYTVVLKKDELYSSSGEIMIHLSTDKLSEIYWRYSIESCDGIVEKGINVL